MRARRVVTSRKKILEQIGANVARGKNHNNERGHAPRFTALTLEKRFQLKRSLFSQRTFASTVRMTEKECDI